MNKRTTGEKIKRISNIICIIMAFFCIAAGIVVYSFGVEDGIKMTQYLGIAIIPVGCATFCLLDLILSGFAEIVDNVAKIAKTTKQTSEDTKNQLDEIKSEVEKVKLAFEFRNTNN